MVQAILFDSDGVLVDTERLFFDATQAAFQSGGGLLSDNQWATWYLAQGKRSREIAALLGIPPSRIEDVIARRDRLFWNQIDQGTPLFPGGQETLKILARHFRLAVVTGASRSHYDRVHTSTGLRDFFEVAITGDEYEHGKPHPESYLTAMQRLTLKPDQCLAVEDSPRGASAARAAGIRCVVIPTFLTDIALCPADCVIMDSVTRLAGLLDRLRYDP